MTPPDAPERESAPIAANSPLDPGVIALASWIDRALRRLISDDAEMRAMLPTIADYLNRLAEAPDSQIAQSATISGGSATESGGSAAERDAMASGGGSGLNSDQSLADGPRAGTATRVGTTDRPSDSAGVSKAAAAAAVAAETRVVPLRMGWGSAEVAVAGSEAEAARARAAAIELVDRDAPPAAASGVPEADIGLIARRCRIKARACDLVVRRLDLEPGTDEYEAVDGEIRGLIEQAKALPLCFLWAPFRMQVLPATPIVVTAARCYANLAAAAELMIAIDGHGGGARFLGEGLHLMAEAQSALRAILARTWLTREEQDQLDAYWWVRRRTAAEQMYVDRYMRADDVADPEQHAALGERISALLERVRSLAQQGKAVTAVLNKLRYHARKLAADPEPSPETMAGLRAAAEVAEDAGMAPNDARTLEALAAALPRLDAEGEENGFLAEAARAAQERSGRAAAGPAVRSYSAGVLRVREALRGRTVVMTGGVVYSHQRRRLMEAFELGDLNWVEQNEHATSEPFEAPIARPETHLVLSLVKLTGHQHLDDVRRWCRQYERPLVLLKAGYSPEQVAAAVLEQASGTLGIE